jgi:hypothetical protein
MDAGTVGIGLNERIPEDAVALHAPDHGVHISSAIPMGNVLRKSIYNPPSRIVPSSASHARSPRRFEMLKWLLPVLTLSFAATSGFAQQPPVEVRVDNLRLEGSTVHAIVRVVNRSDQAYRSVQIVCAFLSQGRAIDTSIDLVPNIEAKETVYTKVIGVIGAEAAKVDQAQCRVTNTH